MLERLTYAAYFVTGLIAGACGYFANAHWGIVLYNLTYLADLF